jgi:hypothetical protein
MRLLKYDKDGELIITSFHENKLPPYAILSHTWGVDTEEVTFADLVGGNIKAERDHGKKPHYKKKPGYKKIRLCGERAQQDQLQYFWVDTCCIDKSDKAELSFAIQSMFRWYQKAIKCYAYLSDVSTKKRKVSSTISEHTWEPSFTLSRWFTRGWTLQELLAPSTVEFFSENWERLGDRMSLKSLIHKITSIPCEVLEGAPILQFSVDERFRWRHNRHTKVKEDAAYSMSGIFDINMAPIYGEGAEQAFGRLHDKIRKQEECLRDLCGTDPRNDKKRIEDTKGGLLADSYRWVLDSSAFQQWQQGPHNRLLWVKGDPGKGKTMLLCGIINELNGSMPRTALLSYFFCQATDSRINSATAVLRGLLYMLVDQQPSLTSHVRKSYDRAGKSLFEDANAWVALTSIFVDVLQDPSQSTTYLVIDALDECVNDRKKLLEFIAKQSSTSDRIKWIVSSRNWPDIGAQLEQAGHKVRLSLELNAKSVAAAVNIFIHQKVDQLALEKQYKEEIRHAVLQHLTSNANDTFLWVALVCQDLKGTPKWNVLKKLASFPPGLDALYRRMIQQISKSDGAEICQQVLASTAVLYRPVMIQELVALVRQLDAFVDDLESVHEIIGLCGSFLTLREGTIYFVHQSAKDFLFAKASSEIFPNGAEEVHRTIFSRSLAILSNTLHRDMYGLKALGFPIENVTRPNPDPLALLRYPCVYWIDHLHDSKPNFSTSNNCDLQVRSLVDKFLRTKYLYWLEGLSLCKSLGRSVVSITELWSLVQVWHQETVCLYRKHYLNANVCRRCKNKINLPSLFKTHGDLLCITKGQLRVTLFKHMYLRCCLVQQVV